MDTITSENGITEHWHDYTAKLGFISRHRTSDAEYCVLCCQAQPPDSLASHDEMPQTQPETAHTESGTTNNAEGQILDSETNDSAVEAGESNQLQPSTDGEQGHD